MGAALTLLGLEDHQILPQSQMRQDQQPQKWSAYIFIILFILSWENLVNLYHLIYFTNQINQQEHHGT